MKKVICKCCGTEWTQRSIWNFHNLCHNCFAEFDHQKMRARFSRLFTLPVVEGYEDSDEWVKTYKIVKGH